MKQRRGFMLVLCLFLLIILLTLGIGLSGKKVAQYRAAVQVGPAAQALAMAESGLADAVLKLSKDPDFPPTGDQTQTSLTYTENFLDMDGATVLGSYTVTVDSSRVANPYGIVLLISTGTVGPSSRPVAQRRISAELDIFKTLRNGSGNPNPNLYRLVNWHDLGSP